MHFIQTLQISPGKDPYHDSFGWAAPEYHLMGWALSCLLLHKLYGNITLYANSPAARLLIDTLQLPYNKVCLTHDRLTLIHPDLWALPKIYTYSLQEQPFLHIDGDVFLFNPFDSELLRGELIAQNLETATDRYYIPVQKELMRYFTFFPPCVKKDFESGHPVQSVNAGILGGCNVSFFHDYADSAFEYIHKNADKLKYVNVGRINVFLEQHLFRASAREKDIPIQVLFNEIVDDNGYKHAGDFHDVPFNKSYLHLLGDFKRDEVTCIRMAAKLRELYPDYYDRITDLFRNKNLQLSPAGFITRPPSLISEENNSHLQLLKFIENGYFSEIEKESIHNDFETFYRKLLSFLRQDNSIECLYKRDLSAQHWVRDLFADTSHILNQQMIRCSDTDIIESEFNWAGLFNKYYRVGTAYYSDLQISKDHFFNLVVREASDNGFSLYDADCLEYAILQFLSEPLSVNELLIKMQTYFEEDVLRNHYEAFTGLVFSSIKQLMVNKAIRPI